jgi:hypothetical protein
MPFFHLKDWQVFDIAEVLFLAYTALRQHIAFQIIDNSCNSFSSKELKVIDDDLNLCSVN